MISKKNWLSNHFSYMGYILYYYSYSLEPKEPNQHVGTMRRRPHQYTSACIWLWCTFVVFWLARYIFWYLCMQLQCVAVRILAHNSSSNSSSCCLYIVKKGVWTSDKLSQLMLLECGRRTEQTLRSLHYIAAKIYPMHNTVKKHGTGLPYDDFFVLTACIKSVCVL